MIGIKATKHQARKNDTTGEIAKQTKQEIEQVIEIQREHSRRLKKYKPEISKTCAAASANGGERYVKG